jgi:hypothetical protein
MENIITPENCRELLIKISDTKRPRSPTEVFDTHLSFVAKAAAWSVVYNFCVQHGMETTELNQSGIERVITFLNSKLGLPVADKTKVVCFCGSTRFADHFMIKRWELEKQGIITFGINILPNNYFAEGNAHGAEQEGVKDILDELHQRKIDLSDEVFILNVGGYIGESTRKELNYALKIGKPVKYLEPIK